MVKSNNNRGIHKQMYKFICTSMAIILSITMLSGCGSQTQSDDTEAGKSAGESVSDSMDASDEAGSGASEVSAQNTPEIFSDMEEAIVPDSNVQFDNGNMYIGSDNYITCYEGCDSSKETIIYEADEDCSVVSFTVSDDNIYFVVADYTQGGSYFYKLEYANKNGEITEIFKSSEDEEYTQTDIYDGNLYLSGLENHKVLKLDESGKPGEEVPDDDSLYKYIPEDATIASLSYPYSYYSPAWCMNNFKKIIYKNADSNLVSVVPDDNKEQLTETVIASGFNSSSFMIADDFVISQEYPDQDDYTTSHYFYTDIKSGERKDIFSSKETLLAFGSDCFYLGRGIEGSDKLQYVVSKVSYSDGSQKELFTLDACDKTSNYGVVDYATALGKDLFYIRSIDYAERNCIRKEESPDKEIVFGSRMNDKGYSEAGMTIRYENSAVHVKDDDGKDRIIMTIEAAIPQFNGDTDSDMKLKKYFDDLWTETKNSIVSQQLEYSFGETETDYSDTEDSEQENDDAADIAASLSGSVTYSEIPEDISYQYDVDSEWGTGSYMQTLTDIKYIDPSYICFGIREDDYQSGAAHGNYGTEYYLMDRSAAKKLSLADVVNNSDEEIMDTVFKYFQQSEDDNPNLYFEEAEDTVKAYTPDQLNFYVTNEGINIEFGIYEVTAFAYGTPTITIPFSEFDMKIPLKSVRS